MKFDIWHNIMWSRYKAAVFSNLYRRAKQANDDILVYQIAETEADRANLAPIDRSLHDYPYDLLFPGNYGQVPKLRLYQAVARRAFATDADVTIIAGFERPEFWILLLVLMLRRRRRAVFCDSTAFDNPPSFWKSVAKRFFFSNVHAAFCYGVRSAAYAKSFGVPAVFPRCQAAALPANYRAEAIPSLRRTHVASDRPVYLYVGRLSPEKRVDTLLKAFRRLRETTPTATLRLVGQGPQEDELRALTGDLGLGESVVFTGSKSGEALSQEYLSATCLVLPSWSEPWGLVVNEALHYGCPVVVSHRCGCVPELVEHSPSGLVFTCDDEADLAAKLGRAATQFADVAAVAEDCLRHISTFTPVAAADQILTGLRSLAKGSRTDAPQAAIRSTIRDSHAPLSDK